MLHTVGMTDQQSGQDRHPDSDGDPGRIVVVTPDGMGVSSSETSEGKEPDEAAAKDSEPEAGEPEDAAGPDAPQEDAEPEEPTDQENSVEPQ